MVGSKTWFTYTTDAGTNYAIELDRSNTTAVNAGAPGGAGLPVAALPRNIKPRYALFSSADGFTRRRVVILTPADLAALTPSTSFTPQGTNAVVTLSFSRGEQTRIPKAVDTGLTT